VLTELDSNGQPSATSSVIKLFWSEMAQRMHELAMDIGGMKAVCEPDEHVRAYLYYRASTIFAGTSEIQRDTLAHQVLRMPR
jgi:alkylation response protein AidB-like acyl-CoA dehydrogenase